MSTKIGRDAKTGQFLTVKEAQRRPKTTTVETLPEHKPSHTSPRGRDAGDGRFITIKEAERNPARTVVEQVPTRKK